MTISDFDINCKGKLGKEKKFQQIFLIKMFYKEYTSEVDK